MKTTSRRSAIIQFGALIAGAGTVTQLIDSEIVNKNILPEYHGVPWQVTKPLTAIVIGVGNRSNTYTGYALKYPDELKIFFPAGNLFFNVQA